MRRAVRVALAGAVLLALPACTNQRAEDLRAAIAKLREERVEKDAVEKARQETAQARAERDAAKASVEQARSELEAARQRRDAAKAAYDAEVARNERLRAEIETVARRARAAAARGQELDAKIAREQGEAGWVRDQAAVLAREIRPGDPAWATSRRLETLEQFLDEVASRYPDDPVVARLAGAAIDWKQPGPDEVRRGAELAGQLRDRFAAVYELPAPRVAAHETPVSSENASPPDEEKKP